MENEFTRFYEVLNLIDFISLFFRIIVKAPGYWSRGPVSIPGAIRLPDKQWLWNGVHSALWVQQSSYLEEKVAAPV
jgi:hypothetical protein